MELATNKVQNMIQKIYHHSPNFIQDKLRINLFQKGQNCLQLKMWKIKGIENH